ASFQGAKRTQACNCMPENFGVPRCAMAHPRFRPSDLPDMTVNPYRRTNQIRTRPMTAETMPTIRRILSGVASALFIARRIQAGLAANIRPSSTQRMPTPTRKSVNAMDLIGWQPPAIQAPFAFMPAKRAARFAVTRVFLRPNVYGFVAAAAGGWPDGLAKKRKNSE